MDARTAHAYESASLFAANGAHVCLPYILKRLRHVSTLALSGMPSCFCNVVIYAHHRLPNRLTQHSLERAEFIATKISICVHCVRICVSRHERKTASGV